MEISIFIIIPKTVINKVIYHKLNNQRQRAENSEK